MNSNSADSSLETIGNWQVLRLREVDSTNSFLMRERQHLLHSKRVVLAATQKQGRGRLGRSYVSLPGRHLTFSAVIHPKLPLAKLQGVALPVGIAVARVLERKISGIRLKWPNDVLVGNRKICGILVETTDVESIPHPILILGIGINTEGTVSEFPEELRKVLTTLEEESGSLTSREELFRELLEELEDILDEFWKEGRKPLLEEWMIRASVAGKRVRCLNGSTTEGIFEDLTPEGFPRIRKDDGSLYIHLSGDLILDPKDV